MPTKNFSILVAIDGSESSMKAVDYAIELAKKEIIPSFKQILHVYIYIFISLRSNKNMP